MASFAMNQFQAAVSTVAESAARKERERKGLPEPNGNEESGGDDTTVKAVEAISEEVFGHELADYEKRWAAPPVHCGSERILAHSMGLALARCRWIPVPEWDMEPPSGWEPTKSPCRQLVGLSGPPTDTPLSGHVNRLASHLVYGLVTHFTRKLVLN